MIANERHDETHDELLLSAFCGDLPRDDARLVQRLTACPVCREEFESQESLAEIFGSVGRDLRQVQRDLVGGRRVAGSDLVAPFLRERVAERRTRTHSYSWVPLAAAAALAVTAGGVWMATETLGAHPSSSFPVLLGDDSPEIRVERLEDGQLLVHWPADLPPGGSFELVWRNGGSALALPPRRIETAQWTPSLEEAAALPETFELEVIVRGAQSEPLKRYLVTVSQ